MGNFEKLSVLVIVVVIVMIMVVAIHTWTDDPGDGDATTASSTDGIDGTRHSASLTGTSLTGGSLAGGAGSDAGISAPPPSSAGATASRDVSSDTSAGTGAAAGWSPWGDGDAERGAASATRETEAGEETDGTEEGMSSSTREGGTSSVAAAEPQGERLYIVRSGDTLGHIAQRELGSVRHWPLIQKMNAGVRPESLREGMELKLPATSSLPSSGGSSAATAGVSGPKPTPGSTYVVRANETIQDIAKMAYGDLERWPDIWFANLGSVPDPKVLRRGTSLQLPR